MTGESVTHWCVLEDGSAASDSQPIPLPGWFKIPVDRTISIWRREQDEWESKRQKRLETTGKPELSKKAEEKYKARFDVSTQLQDVLGFISKHLDIFL